ncbi:MAG: DUF1326 domain-containing protein [Actinomycetota bacterium]
MAKVQTQTRDVQATYRLEGTLLEACSCGVLCPCWIGEDPDGGECFSFEAYHIDRGQIAGVDVSGFNYAHISHIPGNVLTPHSWRSVRFLDVNASDEQREAVLDAFRGRHGGPLAEIAELFDEELGVEVADIAHEVVDGTGTLRIGSYLEAEMEPYRGPDGTITTLRDSIFSTVPGSPAWVSKASRHRVELPGYGLSWEFEGRNAIQAVWKMEHSP